MRYVIQATASRAKFVEQMLGALPPHTEVVWEAGSGPMMTFLEAVRVHGDEPAIHFEDDAVPTRFFADRAEKVIASRPGEVIQFFSRRKDDHTTGSRYAPGGGFSFNCCFYMPAFFGRDLLHYFPTWGRLKECPSAMDYVVGDFMAKRRLRYWIHVPSLVQHRPGPSAADPGNRARVRISKTFSNPAFEYDHGD